MIKINEISQLESWLRKNYYFEDGYINELGPTIKDETGNEIVRFRIGIQIKGSWKAGSKVTYHEFVFIARNLIRWSYKGEKINQEIGITDMTVLKDSTNFGVKIENGTLLELECKEILIEGPTIIKTTNKWEITDSFRSFFSLKEIPKPEDWIKWLQKEGIQAVWRYHESEIISLHKVPYPDYSGWFIQKKDKIDSTSGGVFFFEVKKDGPKIEVTIHKSQSDDELWNKITSIIARFPKVKIKSGNCEFSGKRWLKYLEDGTFPN